jgi:hypothetical protein
MGIRCVAIARPNPAGCYALEAHMRVWDVHPGALTRHSRLGDHREIRAIVSILPNGMTG